MRTKILLSTLAFTTALAAGGILVAPAFAQNARSTATTTDDWLSIPQIHDKVEAAGFSDVVEIERERDGYEVEATDPEGRRVELHVDPVTGEVTKTETKRDKRRSERRASEQSSGG